MIQKERTLIELCVLALLHKQDYYGYDLSTTISELINIADGTVYPVLRRLKTAGLVTTYLTEGQGGPPRKYYQITKLGEETYDVEKNHWQRLFRTVNELLED